MAIVSTFQENQNDVTTQMNLPLQDNFVKLLKTYNKKIANAFPHTPHGKDFRILGKFKDFIAFDRGKSEPK